MKSLLATYMTHSAPSEEWNPKWIAFLGERGMSTSQADALERPERRKLNAEFMCWNLDNMTPDRKRRFFS